MRYILGLDEGHTKTQSVIGDETGDMLGTALINGACHTVHGMQAAMESIQESSRQARLKTDLAPEAEVEVVVAGMTGADWPDEYPLLTGNVRSLKLANRVVVKNDSIIALRSGTSARFGAILIAGTGGNCAIKSPSGDEFIYHYYHDRNLQGGIALGDTTLKMIYRAETMREAPTRLKAEVLRLFGFSTVDDLLRAEVEGKLTHDHLKQIAPLVFQAAYDSDVVACKILRDFGRGLAELVTAGLRRFEMTGLDSEVVLSGSIFKGPGTLVYEVILSELHMVAPRARLVNARYEPVVGAYLLGLEELDIPVDQRVMSNIEKSAMKLGLIRVEQ
jgi:N-acetylglucosamine kinase-like BadF-type ATPase